MLKPLLVPIVRQMAFTSGWSFRKALSQHAGRIIMLHGVDENELGRDGFLAQMQWLQKHFQVISLHELVERLGREDPLTGREVVLTFDDGLLNQAEIACPILERLGFPATIFVCPGLIDEGRWMWNQEARARWGHLCRPDRERLASRFGTAPHEEAVIDYLKSLGPGERSAAEDAIREATPGFIPSSDDKTRFDLMPWETLKELNPDLITIGCHTASHPILPTLSGDALAAEIVDSRHRLEAALARPVEFFCYPNGDYDDRVLELVRSTYRSAVTCEGAVVRPGRDLHLLPRIGIADSVPYLAWRFWRNAA